MIKEPEFIAPDGTVRKQHYGSGKQPWDLIREANWAAEFAAGNALKYVRRAAAKNGADDIEKAKWYFAELEKMTILPDLKLYSRQRARKVMGDLMNILTQDEAKILGN
jgi:hypothetical protein